TIHLWMKSASIKEDEFSCNPFDWWSYKKTKYPILAKLAPNESLLVSLYGVSGVPRRLTKFSGNNSRFISSKNN
ncbi:18327_t:CDS:2, partial [Entrophospora sp. SA101]